jgi:UrcA family protein
MSKLLLAAAALTAFAAPAFAQPAVVVRLADLNLSSARDAQTALHRIRRAAVEPCLAVPANQGTGADAVARFDACHREAVAKAVIKLDAPRVSALAGARSEVRAALP